MRVFAFALLAALIGCSQMAVAPGYAGSDRISTSQTKDRLQQRGYSVRAPRGQNWWLSVKEQTPPNAIFRRELPSKTHTFIASVILVQLEAGVPFEKAAAPQGFDDASRHEILEYSAMPDTSRKIPCLSYKQRILVKTSPNAPDTPLHLVEQGVVCEHPTFADTGVRASFSERGLPSELDQTLWGEFDAFIRNLHIESAPGVRAD